MKFGVFDYIEGSDQPLHKTYEERLELVQALETAGFYGYHLSEHHATPLSMTPSPSIFLAAAARETTRIRLGTLLYLLPLYHPLRLLEELCMLDHLCGGRLDIGVGRGISPHEFEAYGEDFEQSAQAFEHAFNVLCQGFTRDRISGYYLNTPIAGSDGATFTVLRYRYAQDKSRVYFCDYNSAGGAQRPAPQKGSAIASFRFFHVFGTPYFCHLK